MGQATVKIDIAPLYETPSLENARIDEMLYGMSVQVLEESAGAWCFVRTEHGTQGYAPASCLDMNVDVAMSWKKYRKSVVLSPFIDVQKAPMAEAPRLLSVPRGGLLVALKAPDHNGWQKVGLTGGTVGYTRASYLGEAIVDWARMPEADLRWNLVESGLSYNGTAYRVGGRTPQGIDAVGLVAMSYMLNGVIIPQEPFLKPGSALQRIPIERMGEGDILYFRHSMGMFMGDGHFVHATEYPGCEGVIVSSLNPRDDDYREDLAEHIVGVGSLF